MSAIEGFARGLAAAFFRSPRGSLLLVLGVAVAGGFALENLPRTEDPKLVNRYARVAARLPGASAERIETLITEVLEDELEEIEQIGLLESNSRTGLVSIELELDDRIRDDRSAEAVWSKIRTRLTQIAPELPAGTQGPELIEQDVSAKAMIAALCWNGSEAEAPLGLMTRLADELANRLRRLPGTKSVEIGGQVDEQLSLDIPAERLAELGLSVAEVARRIEQGDAKLPAGRLFDPDQELALEVSGEFEAEGRIRDLSLAQGNYGAELLVSDLGTLRRSFRDPPADLALIDGRRAVVVAALIEPDQRVDRWAARARTEVEGLARELAEPLSLEVIFDQSEFTRARLQNLSANLGLGALLVILVLAVCMGWRQALLVGTALPLASLMVLVGMQALGIEVNQMSVTGLIIALGLLIDNAIVMVDEVRHLRHAGRSALDSAREAAGHLFLPLLASTLTTVLAFMPIVLMPGPAGEFVAAIGITVILALVSSLFLALTLVPAVAARLAPTADEGRGFLAHGLRSARLAQAYERLLGRLLRRPRQSAALLLLPSLLGFYGASQLPEQFFPPTDRGQFQAQIWMPQGSGIAGTREAAERFRTAACALDGIERVQLFIGKSAPKFYYNIPEGTDGAPYYCQVLIQTLDAARNVELANRLQALADREFPGMQTVVRLLEQGPPFEAPVEVRLFGPDAQTLAMVGEGLRERLTRVAGLVHTRQTLDPNQAKLVLVGDERNWQAAGRAPRELAAELYGLTEGVAGGALLEGDVELEVVVRATSKQRGDLTQLAGLRLAGDRHGAAPLPLDVLGKLERRPEFASLPHRNGERLTTVQGFLEAGLLPSRALTAFQRILASDPLPLPDGYRLEIGGESAERDDAVADLAGSVGVLLVIMVGTLVLSFNSFRLSALILAIAPLAIGCGLGAIWLFGYPFGFMAIIGSMGLVGVAINDSIVVLAGLEADPGARSGDPVAMARVVTRATGHVLATTLTTMAGFLPLILGGGQFWPPLAIAIGIGVAGATLLALVFVPAAYRLLGRSRVPGEALAPEASIPPPGLAPA